MIRLLDILLSLVGLILTLPILLIVTILGYFETKSPIFIQERVGKNKKSFKLIKFRTMAVDTKSVASHLVGTTSITKLGGFLRKTKIDELPQLINVLKGEMSLVGPRPNLFNQEDVIQARDKYNIYRVLPGITGLAQIQEIDMRFGTDCYINHLSAESSANIRVFIFWVYDNYPILWIF